jgi:hypothetical protein
MSLLCAAGLLGMQRHMRMKASAQVQTPVGSRTSRSSILLLIYSAHQMLQSAHTRQPRMPACQNLWSADTTSGMVQSPDMETGKLSTRHRSPKPISAIAAAGCCALIARCTTATPCTPLTQSAVSIQG